MSRVQFLIDLFLGERDFGSNRKARCASCLNLRRDIEDDGCCHPCSKAIFPVRYNVSRAEKLRRRSGLHTGSEKG